MKSILSLIIPLACGLLASTQLGATILSEAPQNTNHSPYTITYFVSFPNTFPDATTENFLVTDTKAKQKEEERKKLLLWLIGINALLNKQKDKPILVASPHPLVGPGGYAIIYEFPPVADLNTILPTGDMGLGWTYSYALYNGTLYYIPTITSSGCMPPQWWDGYNGALDYITAITLGYPIDSPYIAWTVQPSWLVSQWYPGATTIQYYTLDMNYAIYAGQYSIYNIDQPAFFFSTAGPPGGYIPATVSGGGTYASGETTGPIPEPETFTLLIIGIIGLGSLLKIKKHLQIIRPLN